MLIQILPERIGDAWDVLRPVIAPALPKESQINTEDVANVLFSLLMERAQLWVYYREGEQEKPRAVIVTTLTKDEVLRRASLLVYTAVALDNLTKEDYDSATEALYSYAEGLGMDSVVAHTSDEAARLWLQRGARKISNLLRL